MSNRHPDMPKDTPDYLFDAWAGCVLWAAGEPDIIAAFEASSGLRTTAKIPVGVLNATDRTYAKAFIEWVNTHLWGPMDAPEPH